MTNYNKRLNEILYRFAVDTHESKPGQDETPNFDKAKQAITSLIKELVAEAKPELPALFTELDDISVIMYKKGTDEYEANLLKALEEV